MSVINTQLQDNIGTITFNDPEHRNALSGTLISEMLHSIAALQKGKMRVLIIRAPKGAKVWSAGTTCTNCRFRGATRSHTTTRW